MAKNTLLRTAWLAILLGIGIEVLLLIIAAAAGQSKEASAWIPELVQKISWSTIVCLGLAVGTAASRSAALSTGLTGFFSAPLAFNVARALHKGVANALSNAPTLAAAGGSPLVLSLLKALEYGVLGALLGWMGRKSWGRAGAHASGGLAVGLVFGGGMIVAGGVAGITTAALLSKAVNEVLFPVGCSLALYAAKALGQRATSPS